MSRVARRKRWTQTSVTRLTRHNRLRGRISRHKMCLADTKGENVTSMLKNSLHADFRAVHRQVISRISHHTVCEINTINAVCRWENRPSEMTWFTKRESNGTESNAFQIISLVWCTVTVLVHPCSVPIYGDFLCLWIWPSLSWKRESVFQSAVI